MEPLEPRILRSATLFDIDLLPGIQVFHDSPESTHSEFDADDAHFAIERAQTTDAIVPVTVKGRLETNEAGDAESFSLVLDSQPTADVIIPIRVLDETEGAVSTNELRFTAENWNERQFVTVTGVDDNEDDGDVSYRVEIGPAQSDDPNYDGLDAPDIDVINRDDDEPSVPITDPPLDEEMPTEPDDETPVVDRYSPDTTDTGLLDPTTPSASLPTTSDNVAPPEAPQVPLYDLSPPSTPEMNDLAPNTSPIIPASNVNPGGSSLDASQDLPADDSEGPADESITIPEPQVEPQEEPVATNTPPTEPVVPEPMPEPPPNSGPEVAAVAPALAEFRIPETQQRKLNEFHSEIESAVQRAMQEQDVALLTTTGSIGAFTVGYLAWAIRGGSLLSSMLMSMPAWKSVDPIPVLERAQQDEHEGIPTEEDEVDDLFTRVRQAIANRRGGADQ